VLLAFSRREKLGRNGKFSTKQKSNSMSFFAAKPKANSRDRFTFLEGVDWRKKVIAQSENDEVLIFIHGYNTKQSFFLERFDKIKRGVAGRGFYGFKGAVIGFDWPSLGDWSDYLDDRDGARDVGVSLIADCILPLLESRPSLKIHVLAHSMGTLLTAQALLDSYKRGLIGQQQRVVDQVMFVASDTNRESMRVKYNYGSAMAGLCNRLTNYYSMSDLVLSASGTTFNALTERTGMYGLHRNPYKNFHDVSCTQLYRATHPGRKHGTIRSHGFYFDDNIFYRDVVGTLSGKRPAAMQTRKPFMDGDQQLVV
jgi:esterase/lipase superfamily enzyme